MSDHGTKTPASQLAVACGFCGSTVNVKWFCKSCVGSMCHTCKIGHLKIFVFKKHIIVPRTNDVIRLYGPSKIAEHCKIHQEKEISTYCNDCQVPCCVTCQVHNHKCHDISCIEEAYLSAEKRLNDNVTELEQNVIPKLNILADQTTKDRSEKQSKINRVRIEVNAFRNKMKKAVDETCDDLLEKLDPNDTESQNFLSRIETQKGKVVELIKKINGIIQKGDLDMIKFFPPSPGTLVLEVPSPKLTVPIFTPGSEILTFIRERPGKIEWTESDDTLSSKSIASPSPITTFDRSIINVRLVASFMSKINVICITTAGNNTAWVMNFGSNTMYLYDGSGKEVKSITLKGKNGINDMVIRRSGEMIVACKCKKVRRVSVNGEVSTLVATFPFDPEGVCLTNREDLVVGMGDQAERNHVAVFSIDTSEKLREIRIVDGQGKQLITQPYRVVYNGKDLCVVNRNPGNEVCVDETGDLRWMYDGKEAKLARLFDPHGISVDRHNNILVTDVNNECVHYIDREGSLIKIILTQDQTGLLRPWGICVDDRTGHAWVGGSDGIRSNKINILKYLL